MKTFILSALSISILFVGLIALADTVILKDGTRIEATSVMRMGSQVRLKMPDGSTRTISSAQVKEVVRGNANASGAGAGAGAGAADASGGATVPPKGSVAPPSAAKAPAGTSGSFAQAKSKADAVDAPIIAVSLWEKFIDAKPAPADLAAAQAELAKWQQLQKDNAERINGKWVGGDERKKLLKDVDELVREGSKELQGAQTVQGIKKLEEALKMYPNSFEANFTLGYYYLTKGAIGATGRGNVQYQDKAIKSLEAASRILPTSAATWSNLAIGYNFRNRYVDSVQAAYKAAKIRDDKDIVQNLVNSIAHAPGGMQQNNAKIKPIMEDTIILARKHGIALGGTPSWNYIPVDPKDVEEAPGGDDDPKTKKRAGVVWMGSAFFVSEDGYLITNHHVATGDPKSEIQKDISFRVRFDDGTEKNAELIAVDDAADIALMKVKTDRPVPYLKIADDNPKQASKALVLGYPATGEDNPTLQISEGQVKSVHPGDEHEVWFDLNTTHGNSGGPIVDRNGRVVAILTGGREVYNVVYVLGVGPKQIQRFLAKVSGQAPKLEYAEPGTGEFDGEKLTEEARKCTLLVLAIRGAGSDAGSADGAADAKEKPPEGTAGAEGAGAAPEKGKE